MDPGKRLTSPAASTAPKGGPTDPRRRTARAIETVAFFVLLLVVAMRPLISETYDAQFHSIDRAIGMPAITTPATTAWFDLAIWSCAVAVAVAVVLDRRPWRLTGVEIGWLVMILAAGISTWPASNQRLALNASADWLTAGVLLMTLTQVARVRWRAILILTVIVASSLTAAARCGMQVGVEFRETIAEYEQTKEVFWRQQGIALDAPEVELFERRMAARQATGFFPYSNVQAAGLALAGFAALALMATAGTNVLRRSAWAAVAAVLFAAILLTSGRGALLAAVIGLLLWWCLARWQSVWKKHWSKALLVAGLLAVLGAAGVVGWGRLFGGLPGASLDFRWNYWQATVQMIDEHPWTGVGALNFDRAYLAYKPIEYPEEIKDPHNFLLSIVAQWGALGGVGLLMCLIGGTWTWLGREGRLAEVRTAGHGPPVRTLQGWSLALVPGFLALRLIVLAPMLRGDLEGKAFVAFDLGLYGLLWCLCMIILTYLVAPAKGRVSDPIGGRPGEDASGGLDRIAVVSGLIAFLIQDTISFAMFYPGTLAPWVAMGAVLFCQPVADEETERGNPPRAFPLALAIVGLAVFVYLVFVPVTRSARWLAEARAVAGERAVEAFEKAAAADPLDPAPMVELALREAAQLDLSSLDRAVGALRAAILRDPDQLLLYRYQAQVLAMRYRLSGAASDMWTAIGAARRAVTMYPSSPDVHLDLAELLDEAARDWQSPVLREEALEHYAEALRLNDARPDVEVIRRWSADTVARVRDRMQRLSTLPMDDALPDTSNEDDDPDDNP